MVQVLLEIDILNFTKGAFLTFEIPWSKELIRGWHDPILPNRYNLNQSKSNISGFYGLIELNPLLENQKKGSILVLSATCFCIIGDHCRKMITIWFYFVNLSYLTIWKFSSSYIANLPHYFFLFNWIGLKPIQSNI